MQCPNCSGVKLSLFNVKDSEVVVDACKKCGGVWFDTGELQQVLPSGIRVLGPGEDAENSERKCPKCERRLKKRKPGFSVKMLQNGCIAQRIIVDRIIQNHG